MKESAHFPVVFWRLMSRMNRRMVAKYGQKSNVTKRILILTTLGRKSGQLRTTPLQYEEIDNVYYVASARGVKSDWYRNLEACPQVEVQVGDKRFTTHAKPMTDAKQIADFLELRLKRHPRFMGFMLRLEGLPGKYGREDLEKLASRLAIVELSESN